MPVLACPKCATGLRVPDGSVAAVRCPKCKTVFSPPAPPPAFEVVDESPAPLPPPPPPPKSTVRPAPRPAEPEPEFEVIDEPAPRKRSRRDDDDDDDDRPRGRRRGRRNRRRIWDDLDAYDKAVTFRRGKVACLLLSISVWLYMGALGVATLLGLLFWAGSGVSFNLLVIPGLVGAGNWVVALVGLGFAVAGPRHGKGLAVGALSVAGVHFILVVVCFVNLQGGVRGLGGFGVDGLQWATMITMLPVVDALLPALIYSSGVIGTEFVFGVLTGGCEIARLVLILLMLQAFARAARDGGAEDKATNGVIVVSVTCGAVALVATLVAVITYEAKMSSGLGTLGMLTFLGSFTAYTVMLIVPGVAAVETKDALDRRS